MLEELVKYYDENRWLTFFKNELAELYSSVCGLLRLRDALAEQISDKTVGELLKEDNLYREMLFGGFTGNPENPFSENALAEFYYSIFGIGISDDDIRKIISRIKEGMTFESAVEDVYVSVERVESLEILTSLKAKLSSVYNILGGVVEKPKEREYEIINSMIGATAFKDVLDAAKKILPLYNDISFFINSIFIRFHFFT